MSGENPHGPRGGLRLLDGGRDTAFGRAPSEIAASRGAVRAGDRHDAWTLAVTPDLRRLAAVAGVRGVELDLAVRLVVERALAQADLRALGVDPATLASGERVDGELDAAASAYLRRLANGDDAAPRALGDHVTVGLPLRLATRLSRADLGVLLAGADLEQALAWELAAVLQGRTMSEWAALAALRGRRET